MTDNWTTPKICYNLDVPMESIPEDFVPLKNFFNMLLQKSAKMRFRIIILLGYTQQLKE